MILFMESVFLLVFVMLILYVLSVFGGFVVVVAASKSRWSSCKGLNDLFNMMFVCVVFIVVSMFFVNFKIIGVVVVVLFVDELFFVNYRSTTARASFAFAYVEFFIVVIEILLNLCLFRIFCIKFIFVFVFVLLMFCFVFLYSVRNINRDA